MTNSSPTLSKPLAIHDRPGSFSDGWVAYCLKNNIKFVRVNCFDDDIVEQLQKCSGLMWHWSHLDASAANFARQLTRSLETMGLPVFPSSLTSWHFDDKVGQKYLLESLDIPHVPSHVFYDERTALQFVAKANFPLVFKLAGGAGSMNVLLMDSPSAARQAIRKSFSSGWKSRNRTHVLREYIRRARQDRTLGAAAGIAKGIVRSIRPHRAYRDPRRAYGYVYFQEFIHNNDSDVRIVVSGGCAYGFRRMTRENDFRASGSGIIDHSPGTVPVECVQIAFDAATKMGLQIGAFDFVFEAGEPLIVEISYGFKSSTAAKCPGYWDRELRFHEADINPEEIMISNFLSATGDEVGKS